MKCVQCGKLLDAKSRKDKKYCSDLCYSRSRHRRDNRLGRSSRKWQLPIKYGITEDIYNAKCNIQQNLCAICRRPERSTLHGKIKHLAVDHDHETNQVRDLLCADCNRALGMFGDSVLVLESALNYLKKWEK